MNDDVPGTGSQGMQYAEEQDGDSNDDDDVHNEGKYDNDPMPKHSCL